MNPILTKLFCDLSFHQLRLQAQNELKVLRAEVTQKKINAGMQRELQRTAIETG